MNTRALQLEELYTTERARLRSFVRRLVGNPSTAEDLVQQAFANLLAKGEKAGSQNPAYVSRAVRNQLSPRYPSQRGNRAFGRHSRSNCRQASDVFKERICPSKNDFARFETSLVRGSRPGSSEGIGKRAAFAPIRRVVMRRSEIPHSFNS